MKRLLIFFPFLILVSCHLEKQISINNELLLIQVLDQDYSLKYDKSAIDKKLIKLLKKEKNFLLDMVNPGEDFNDTDIPIKNYPDKRIIVLGQGNKNLSLVLYEQQTLNRVMCLIYKKLSANNYSICIISLPNTIRTINAATEAIEKKDFRLISQNNIAARSYLD